MLSWIRDKITAHLLKRTFENGDEIFLYLLTYAANLYCLLIHSYLCVIYMACDMAFLALFNLGSILYFLGVLLLLKRRKYVTAGMMISAEVSLYCLLCSFLIGIDTYIIGYFLLVIVMQVMVPYGPAALRGVVIGAEGVCATVCMLISLYHAPAITLAPGLQKLLLFSNVYILFIGIAVELYIGNIVSYILKDLDDSRIRELSNQAYTDALTGLYNRRYAQRFFEKLKGNGKRYCVAMVDIDDFKVINDTYGHSCGDEILRFLASFLLKNLRKTEVVFRWGGEEFLIVLEGVEPAVAYGILEKLRTKLETWDITTQKGILRIKATMGAASLDPYTADEDINRCDQALYEGKRSGKNKVVLYHAKR